MADADLTQPEADYLIALDKYAVDRRQWPYPSRGGKISVPLQSADRTVLRIEYEGGTHPGCV